MPVTRSKGFVDALNRHQRELNRDPRFNGLGIKEGDDMTRYMNFNDFKAWLFGVDPENRGIHITMEQVALLVLSAQDDPEIVKQAQQIVGGK